MVRRNKQFKEEEDRGERKDRRRGETERKEERGKGGGGGCRVGNKQTKEGKRGKKKCEGRDAHEREVGISYEGETGQRDE